MFVLLQISAHFLVTPLASPLKSEYFKVWLKCKCPITLGPAYNEFGYNEHPDTKSK